MSLKFLIIFAVAIVFNAAANILIKLGMKNQSLLENGGPIAMVKAVLLNPVVLLGLTFFGLAFGAYSVVLSKVNLSIAYPIMTSVGFVLVGVASVLLFKETITLLQAVGIGLIVGGVWLVSAAA